MASPSSLALDSGHLKIESASLVAVFSPMPGSMERSAMSLSSAGGSALDAMGFMLSDLDYMIYVTYGLKHARYLQATC